MKPGQEHPVKHIQESLDPWPFARCSVDAASFLPQAGRCHSLLTHRAAGRERWKSTQPSPGFRRGITCNAFLKHGTLTVGILLEAKQSLHKSWLYSGSYKNETSTKQFDEQSRPGRPLQETRAKSFQYKPVCFYFLI